MILHRRIVVWTAVVACVVPQLVEAQATTRGNAERWSIGVAGDLGAVPDELSSQCGEGSNGGPMVGAGVSLLFHQRPWLVISTDTRASAVMPVGCKLTIPAPIQLGPNHWATAVGRDLTGVPTAPLVRSAMRVGVETIGGGPLLRATVGGGLLWARKSVPFASATVGLGSRGTRFRFYADCEASVVRLRVRDSQTFFHFDSTTGPSTEVIDSQRSTPVVLHPKWGAVHVGVEVPLVLR